jgi:hypothetical protein
MASLPPQPRYTPVTPIPPTQYAPPPPPPVQDASGPQVFQHVYPVLQPMPTQKSGNMFLKVVIKTLSIIGIIFGSLSILLGFLGLIWGGEDFASDFSFAGIFIFLGLMILFIALIRKTRTPISRKRQRKATIGLALSILGGVYGIVSIILGAKALNSSVDIGTAIFAAFFIFSFSFVIWLVTRIKTKKSRNAMPPLP